MKLVMHTARGVSDEIDDTHPDFAAWLERTPPGWSNGYVWVTAEETNVRAHLPGQHDQQSHNPHKGGGYTVDPRITGKAREQVEAAMKRLEDTYGPTVTEGVTVRAMTLEDMRRKPEYRNLHDQPLGFFNSNRPDEIVLTQRALSDPDETTRVVQQSVRSGHFVSQVPPDVSGIEKITIHEVGHLIDTRYRIGDWLIDDSETIDPGWAKDAGLVQMYEADLGRYALRNNRELLAEAFVASVYSTEDNASYLGNLMGTTVMEELVRAEEMRSLS